MSDSPETDALADLLLSKCSHSESCYYEMRILARRLERERDAERSISKRLEQENAVAYLNRWAKANERAINAELERDESREYAKRLQLELNEVKSDLEFRRDLYKLQTERINAMQTYAYLKQENKK